MRTLLFATALIALTSTVVGQEAQPTMKPSKDPAMQEKRVKERAEKRTATLQTELGLTDEQAVKVGDIQEKHALSVAELRKAGLDEEARKVRLKVLRQNRDNALQKVLSVEQYERLLTLRQQKKDKDDDGEVKGTHNE